MMMMVMMMMIMMMSISIVLVSLAGCFLRDKNDDEVFNSKRDTLSSNSIPADQKPEWLISNRA